MEISEAIALGLKLQTVETDHSPEYVKACVILTRTLLQTRKELAEATAELTALREQVRWIPVSERLPETDNMAYDYEPATKKLDVIRLLASTEDQVSKYDRGYLFKDGCWRNEAGNIIYVNYWKEILPQPPEWGQK